MTGWLGVNPVIVILGVPINGVFVRTFTEKSKYSIVPETEDDNVMGKVEDSEVQVFVPSPTVSVEDVLPAGGYKSFKGNTPDAEIL